MITHPTAPSRGRLRSRARRRGAIVILFAILLIVVVAFFALSVDLGYVCAVRTDLQSAVDAGALAGAGVILDGEDKAIFNAERFTQMNIDNAGVHTPDSDQKVTVELGNWNAETRVFTPGGVPQDAVKVTALVEKAPLFFGRAVGHGRFLSEASAVASYLPRDIMLVLDVSGSMNEDRNGMRKIDELRSAVQTFMAYLKNADGGDRVGFTYYSSHAHLGSSLSLDLDSVESQIIAQLNAAGRTNISDGMLLARQELTLNRRRNAKPLMVVLTDGAANTVQPGDIHDDALAKAKVIVEAEAAALEKIPIFTMALDSQSSEVDVALMQQVATISGSESFHVLAGEQDLQGNTQLQEAFRRVAADRPLRIVD